MESKNLNLLPILLILGVLAIGVVIISVQQPKLTGFAVLSEYPNETACVAAGYAWQEVTNESCSPETSNVVETGEISSLGYTLTGAEDATNFIIIEAWDIENESSPELIPEKDYNLDSLTGIVTNATTLIYSTVEFNYTYETETCEEVVVGGECIGNVCGDSIIQAPNGEGITEVCDNGADNGVECDPEYGGSCTWCSSDCLTITTEEGGYCGDEICQNPDESYPGCAADCEAPPKTTTTEEEEAPIITGETVNICAPNWQCSAWSECVDETQTRTCEDANNCGTEDGKPALLQSCTPPETCSDGIKNQDEIGIDCGGVCEQRCGIFTIIGSAITGPIESGKEFFLENKLKGFLILGGIIILIGGGVAIGILSKKGKINLKKFIKKNIIPDSSQ